MWFIWNLLFQNLFPWRKSTPNKGGRRFPSVEGNWHLAYWYPHGKSLTEPDLNLPQGSRNRHQNRTVFWRQGDWVWPSLWSPVSHWPPTALSKIVYLKSIKVITVCKLLPRTLLLARWYFHPRGDYVVWLPGSQFFTRDLFTVWEPH